jgi:hypothetical protein
LGLRLIAVPIASAPHSFSLMAIRSLSPSL